MRCPYCQTDDDRVVDSRLTDEGTAIRRRRECNQCQQRFTTYERLESEDHLRVVKSDGRIELFDRHKVLKGLLIACEKRPVTTEALEALITTMYQDMIAEGSHEISSEAIGRKIMVALRTLDEVAYVRFASVYRQFKDVDDFMLELRNIIGKT
ncbi:MAG: transcriptional repressor NrdR [Planctomycetes bacterium]|nr:transcriptional repressor NrdR [Planctomycetota bacterium]